LDELSSEGDDGRTPTSASEVGVDELQDEGDSAPGSGDVSMEGTVSTSSESDLKTKLRKLRSIRTELDQDIRSMERALSIMADESP